MAAPRSARPSARRQTEAPGEAPRKSKRNKPRRVGFVLPCGQLSRSRKQPFAIDELNRLLAASRHELGAVAGIPAATCWRALLLALLDTCVDVGLVLQASVDAYDPPRETLAVGPGIYRLHRLTVEALDALLPFLRTAYPKGRLIPWPKDRGRAGEMLFATSERSCIVPVCPMTDSSFGTA